jgi:ATP-dependent DNA helicase RecG
MNRLLEGDVGSGKTVVAAIAAFASFINGFQAVFMAPTQILAQQHYETLSNIFKGQKIRINLITSSFKKNDLGRADIFIGTHALIHQKINFDKVALVVIDEQHRFGVEQREHLIKIVKKRLTPHVLTMTATPIPRTVALTLYGDLDLSTLNELPLGRQKIVTWIVPPFKQGKAYPWISQQIQKENIQVFIVCPLIEESEVETMKTVASVKKKYQELKNIFKKEKLGLLHGKLPAKEKDKVISEFRKGKIDILVTTPVVEVGIDVPNATIMIIEGAERFGLAQLHQLRGRVGRSEKKSYSLLFTKDKSPKVLARLEALSQNLSGFTLAELDLKLRGPGEILGMKQHGYLDLKIASWSDTDLINLSQKVAGKIKILPKHLEKQIVAN